MPISAIIFDMDGVLCDSEPLHMRAWQEVLREFGVEIVIESLHQWIGVADTQYARHSAEHFNLPIGAEELLARKREAYRVITATELALYPGVLAGIRQAAARKLPLAVATASARSEAERNLEHVGVLPYLSALVVAEDVRRPKPAPDPFLLAAERIGIPPVKCAVVEDSPTGIAAARAAGCTVLAVATTHAHARLAEAHFIFDSPEQALVAILARK